MCKIQKKCLITLCACIGQEITRLRELLESHRTHTLLIEFKISRVLFESTKL